MKNIKMYNQLKRYLDLLTLISSLFFTYYIENMKPKNVHPMRFQKTKIVEETVL